MFKKVGMREQVKPGEVLGLKVDAAELALYEFDGEVLATDDVCTHAYCLLSENAEIVDDGIIECTCHGSRFNVRTGESTSPPSSDPLPTYQVEVRGAEVFVDLD